MLSGIQHFMYCRRQWALIHIEKLWEENVHTVIGELMHKKAHDPNITQSSKDVIVSRAMPIMSRQLGISGECDVVEFHRSDDGINLHGHRGTYSVYPVEYKKGKSKISDEDRLQLTTQVLCLEEMFSTVIDEGSIYYGETRRRERVPITRELRQLAISMLEEMHNYYNRGYTPKAKKDKRCSNCSLQNVCMPNMDKATSVSTYMSRVFEEDA